VREQSVDAVLAFVDFRLGETFHDELFLLVFRNLSREFLSGFFQFPDCLVALLDGVLRCKFRALVVAFLDQLALFLVQGGVVNVWRSSFLGNCLVDLFVLVL